MINTIYWKVLHTTSFWKDDIILDEARCVRRETGPAFCQSSFWCGRGSEEEQSGEKERVNQRESGEGTAERRERDENDGGESERASNRENRARERQSWQPVKNMRGFHSGFCPWVKLASGRRGHRVQELNISGSVNPLLSHILTARKKSRFVVLKWGIKHLKSWYYRKW